MPRSPFGWSLPPGAAGDPNAPWNQVDPPCDVCGQHYDDCVCPECPVCGEFGNPSCYDDLASNPGHGLILSFAQVALKAEADRLDAIDIAAELAADAELAAAWARERDEAPFL